MPRNVRNFWLRGHADGAREISAGPRSRDGGAKFTLYQRAAGDVAESLQIGCYADGSGALETEVSADVAECPALRVTSTRDGGEPCVSVRFVGGFSDSIAEALELAAEANRAAAQRDRRNSADAEATREYLLERAREFERIRARYFARPER